MDRRSFLRQAGLVATWLSVTIIIQGCSDDDESPTTPTGVASPDDINGAISANHGHTVVVTSAQITQGDSVTLTLDGGGHTHTVTLTSLQVQTIGTGTTTQVTSTNDSGHTHTVTFN